MAAKSMAAPKNVRTSQTALGSSTYTAAQSTAYRAMYLAALRASRRGGQSNYAMSKRLHQAARRANLRYRTSRRLTAGAVQRTSYLQAKYGASSQAQAVPIPLRSALRTRAQTTSYLQARYGKKTFALSRGKSSVRVPSRTLRKVIVASKVRRPQTTRSNYAAAAQAAAAARRTKANPNFRYMKKRKAPGNSPVADTAWITAANDRGAENCVAVAIANSLLCQRGKRVTDEQVAMIESEFLAGGLYYAVHYQPWYPEAELRYAATTGNAQPGDIIGFESVNGPHCGVLLPGNLVVSWGEVIPLESEIEEAWKITWAVTG